MDCKSFLDFYERYPKETDELLDAITNASCNNKSDDIVTIFDRQTINAANHIFEGSVKFNDQEWFFVMDSGDYNGTVIRQWSLDPVRMEKHEPVFYTFVPMNQELKEERPAMWGVYLYWRKQAWFKDMERSYNYDRYFQPGTVTENHYREMAKKRGLVSMSLESAIDIFGDELK